MIWRDLPIVIVDTETTGKSALTDRVVEIAAVRVVAGEIVGRRGSLINPTIPIPADSTEVHGITNEMVANAPDFVEAFCDLCAFVEETPDAIIAAYNGPFDRGMLSAELLRAGMRAPLWFAGKDEWIDVCVWAKAHDDRRGSGRFKLSNVAARLGVEVSQAHRALGDCETTARVLHALAGAELHGISRLQRMPEAIDDLVLHQRRLRAEFDANFYDWLAGKREDERLAANG